MSTMVFRGIEGSNPLAFLAALGAGRICDLLWRDWGIRMRWSRDDGWRPEVSGLPSADKVELCRVLHAEAPWAPLDAFDRLGENLTVAPVLFEEVVASVKERASREDRGGADFAAAFGSEVFPDEKKGRIQFTDLCFITGSGHQDFLGTARGLASCCEAEHLREALFGPWRYADAGRSLRWDPDDAKEYALRWRNPSIGGVSTVWGANRLAFESLPLFPTVSHSAGTKLRTTGFQRRNPRHEFTWPIWTQWASMDTVRSLLSLREIQEDEPDRGQFCARGIEDIFRVQRVQIGQGANFKVSFRPARAV
jgi:hypothetical protein